MPAPVNGMNAGTASQLIPGVGRTLAEREALSQRDRLGTPHLGVGR
jgi:hypothetical protein